MGRPRGIRTASKQFQDLWDKLDGERRRRGLEPEWVAKKSGFARSSYFVYANEGQIPFNSLEKMAACLKARFSATVQIRGSDVHEAVEPGSEEAAMVDYLEPILELLRQYPDDQRPVVAGVMIGAAVRAVRELPPFDAPAAGHTKASRVRKK